jgi:protein tyrosine phosphatase
MAYSMPAPYSVIQFIRRLRSDMGELKESMTDGPLVAHCYEGGWRCGVFIAIDDNLLMMAQRQQVDVFLSVKKLHEQRLGLVAAPEHIRFIYDVLEDEVLCGVTTVSVDGVLQHIQAKSKRDHATGLNDYQREYRLLESLVPRFSIGDCAAGHMVENRAKNRNVLVVPPDNNRPYLTTLQGNDATNYVNAVFVDSYRKPDEFICTEWPLGHTLSDFWALVHDHKVKTSEWK